MAKQPETRDRFRIICETDAAELGPLLAQLTKMGFENIGYELITDVRTFNISDRKFHAETGDAFAKTWIADHPSFRAIELVEHFRQHDRTSGSAYTALRNLVEEGVLAKLGAGNYTRTDVKVLEAPRAEPETHKRAANTVARYETTNYDVMLKALRGRTKITVKELTKVLEDEGRNRKSASPLVNKMMKEGLLKLIEPGVYQVLKKATKPAKAMSPAGAKKEKDRLRKQAERDRKKKAQHTALNGQAPSTASENANG